MSKTGRNEPCPCGSGRKYKKCCEPLAPKRPGMDEFAQPLVQACDGTPAQIDRAKMLATALFNLALEPNEALQQARIEQLAQHFTRDDEARQQFLNMAAMMLARHRRLFPHLHNG